MLTVVIAALGPDDAAGGTVGAGILGLHPENFATAWEVGRFGSYLRTSLLVSSSVVVVSVVLSILSRLRPRDDALPRLDGDLLRLPRRDHDAERGRPRPAVLRPARRSGLTDSLWAVVLPQVAQSVAFGTFWMRAWFRSANRSLVEAARLDGASTWRVLWQVLVPLARPAVVTLTVLVFMWTWNEFLIPLVMVVSENLRTAPLGLAFFQGQYTQGFTLLAAGAVIVATPVVVLYLFLQRHFIAGMLEGAVRE